MRPKEKLYKLLELFIEKQLDIQLFCDRFSLVFNTMVNYDDLTTEEYKLFEELEEYVSLFSPYPDDFAKYKYYKNNNDIISKAREIKAKLED